MSVKDFYDGGFVGITDERFMKSKPGPGEILLPHNYGTEILRTEVGSTLHGTGLGVASEDHDEMGVYVEHQASTIGLGNKDHFITRTAENNTKSQPGDTDLAMYSLRKWARLAMNGNPSVLLLLFAPDNKVIYNSELGRELRGNASWFASKRGGKAFLGYMESQRQRMVGARGRAGRVRVTDECSACAGTGKKWPVGPKSTSTIAQPCDKCLGVGKCVDWKYAMHMCRLGYQGLEFLSTGRLTLPVPDPEGSWLREVRQGNVEFAEVIAVAQSLEEQMKRRLDDDFGALYDEPRALKIEKWVMDAHLRTWAPHSDDRPAQLVDPSRDEVGSFDTVWMCPAPDELQSFQVIRQSWNEDMSVRTIYEVKVAA